MHEGRRTKRVMRSQCSMVSASNGKRRAHSCAATAAASVAMSSDITFSAQPSAFVAGQLGLFAQAAGSFSFGLGLDDLLYRNGGSRTDLSFDLFASWCILFLGLYLLFALMWKIIPGSGLQKGALPFIASSRCPCTDTAQAAASVR